MKKTVFLALTLALAGGAAAQDPFHPPIVPAGDTLRGRDSTFFYYTWFDTCRRDTVNNDMVWAWSITIGGAYGSYGIIFPPELPWRDYSAWYHLNSNWTIGRRIFTPTPISVIGIAAVGHFTYLDEFVQGSSIPPNLIAMDTSVAGRLPEYLQLYMPKEGVSVTDSGIIDLELIDEAEWHLLYPSKEIVLLDSTGLGDLYEHSYESIMSLLMAPGELYEVYFDSARTVNGTFFVAGTHNNNEYVPYHRDGSSDTTWTGAHMATAYRFCYSSVWDSVRFQYANTMGRNYLTDYWILGLPDSTFFYTYPAKNSVLCMFPIIDTGFVYVPPVCPEVLNLHREETSDPGVLLFWDAHPAQTRWQVAYGSPGMNPDTCSAVVESSRLWCRLTDLRQGEPYAVFARAWCDSTGSWSSWGDSIMVTYGTAGGGTGGDTTAVVSDPSALASFTYLFPNPAAGRVQVASSFGLRGVEVFALDGRRVLSLPASGLTASLDTAAWPRGTYIILIKTPAGSTTKKLSVNGDQ